MVSLPDTRANPAVRAYERYRARPTTETTETTAPIETIPATVPAEPDPALPMWERPATIEPIPDAWRVYRVPSETTRDQWYTVDLVAGTCTCPDHDFRDRRCKHIVEAEDYERDQAIAREVVVGGLRFDAARLEAAAKAAASAPPRAPRSTAGPKAPTDGRPPCRQCGGIGYLGRDGLCLWGCEGLS